MESVRRVNSAWEYRQRKQESERRDALEGEKRTRIGNHARTHPRTAFLILPMPITCFRVSLCRSSSTYVGALKLPLSRPTSLDFERMDENEW